MHLSSAMLLSLVIFIAGLAAGIAPFFVRWSHKSAHRWIAFGAGTILGVAFLHMIPEAIDLAGVRSVPTLLLGFVTLYAIEQFALKHPHEEDEGEFHEIGVLAFLGLTIHDLIDGIALGSGEHIPALTPAIFVALVLHKIPTTFSLSVLLLHGEYGRARIIRLLVILLLAIPAGVLVAQLMVDYLRSAATVGKLIGFSAGTFIYIGAYELLTEMNR
jgi:zinc and cadmium transporter